MNMTATAQPLQLDMPSVLSEGDLVAQAPANLSPLAERLLALEVDSPQFREQMTQKVKDARELIANVAQGSSLFTKRNWLGDTSSKAYTVMGELSSVLEDMNPANQRKLFSSKKLFGKITLWDNFAKYLTRFEKAETSILKLKAQLQSAEQLLNQEMTMLVTDKSRFMQQADQLSEIVRQFTDTETALIEALSQVAKTDVRKATILEQEVLVNIRALKQDALSMQALALAAAKVGDSLLKTGASTVNGCQRVATLGIAALDIAVGMARGTRTQQQVQDMLTSVQAPVESLIAAIGEEVLAHAKKTVEFESNPIVGVQVLQGLFDNLAAADEELKNYRRNASSILAQNNLLLSDAVQRGIASLQDSEAATLMTNNVLGKV